MKFCSVCRRGDPAAAHMSIQTGRSPAVRAIDGVYGRYRNFRPSLRVDLPSSFDRAKSARCRGRLQMQKAEQPTVTNLAGLWRRSLLAWPDGRRDTATWVRWLQGPGLYIDLRQPVGRPDFSAAAGLDDLDLPQIAWLAGQEGFAGELLFEDGFFEWRREVDFQLTATYSDRGSLCFVDGVMVEEGKDNPYIEHWHRDVERTQPVCAVRLEDPTNGCRGFIVRYGDIFMYARGRNTSAPAGMSLIDCVAAAPSAAAARSLIDCEISYGAITTKGWGIEHSSLPFKEGQSLKPRLPSGRSTGISVSDVDRSGQEIERRWAIVDVQGNLRDIFGAMTATIVPLREARS